MKKWRRSFLSALLCVSLGVSLSGPLFAAEGSDRGEVDVSSVRAQFRVFETESGKILVFVPLGDKEWFFWGEPNGKLHRQQSRMHSFSGQGAFRYSLIDRRLFSHLYEVELKDGVYSVHCGEQTLSLEPLDVAEGETKLSGARFLEPLWKRQGHFLGRDTHGVYYYIDKALNHDGAPIETKDYRVYIGWTGELLLAPLSLVAQDSVGEVYGMRGGNRRLVITGKMTPAGRWMVGTQARIYEGSEEREILMLDLQMDSALMYEKSGAYGAPLYGTPCDLFFNAK